MVFMRDDGGERPCAAAVAGWKRIAAMKKAPAPVVCKRARTLRGKFERANNDAGVNQSLCAEHACFLCVCIVARATKQKERAADTARRVKISESADVTANRKLPAVAVNRARRASVCGNQTCCDETERHKVARIRAVNV